MITIMTDDDNEMIVCDVWWLHSSSMTSHALVLTILVLQQQPYPTASHSNTGKNQHQTSAGVQRGTDAEKDDNSEH